MGGGEIVKQLTAVKKNKRKKKIIKLRNFANCEIIELGVAVQGGRGGQVAWYGFKELRVELQLDWNNGNKSLALTNSSHRQRLNVSASASRYIFTRISITNKIRLWFHELDEMLPDWSAMKTMKTNEDITQLGLRSFAVLFTIVLFVCIFWRFQKSPRDLLTEL